MKELSDSNTNCMLAIQNVLNDKVIYTYFLYDLRISNRLNILISTKISAAEKLSSKKPRKSKEG